MNPRTVSARDLETMAHAAHERVELPGPEGGWATAVINGHAYRARVAPIPVEAVTENAPLRRHDGVRLGANRLHQIAGRDTSGNALTICGRTLKTSDPRYIETHPESVPLGHHCLGCWG